MHRKFILPGFNVPAKDERNHMASILKSAGLTLTTSRIDILYHLTHISTPTTASELSKLLDIPLSTTHRNLSVIARAGLASYIIDRLGVSRWFLLVKGKANFCPCCNQEFTICS